MSIWQLVRQIYRRLPAPRQAKARALYRQLAKRLPQPSIGAIIARTGRHRSSAPTSMTLPTNNSKRVLILAPTFFDLDGNNMFYGGAERYLIELVRLIRELGYEPEVYQCANSAWVRYYTDIRIVGLDTGGDMQRLNQQFHALVPQGILTIFLGFNLATPKCHSCSIGISHGIYWDQIAVQDIPDVQRRKLEEVLSALTNLEQVISVDTNTINGVRSTRTNLTEKMTDIPNFVDLEQFHPTMHKLTKPDNDRIVILYPRHLYKARGFWLVTEVLPDLIQKYPQVEFHFVGRADPTEEETVREFVRGHPDQVRWHFLPPPRMHEAYQQADITLIPTIHSEGTSLSCLEALACGNAVIATNVGGLPDLILPGYNGLLIEPNAAALREAIETLIRDKALRLRLGSHGRQVVQAFGLERWQAQWQCVLSSYLPRLTTPLPHHKKVAVFPTTPGIQWEHIKQRPHHLALQLARHGIETFWRNSSGRQPSPQDGLHILAARDDLHVKDPLLLIYYPYHFADIHQFEEFGRSVVICDVLDDISIHDRSDALMEVPTGATARDYHLKLLERADLVLTASRVLQERIQAQRPDVLFIPNGVDLGHFPRGQVSPAAKLARLRRPVIGYHGAIAEWFDCDLLLKVARQRPKYQFVLIGPVSQQKQLAGLVSLPDVRYLGSVPYEQIPSYVAGFDVGILPFVLNALTEGVRPLKVLECLAMGKPVVATPLPDWANWPGALRAHDVEQFAICLDEALESRASLQRDSTLAAFVAASA